MRALYYRTKCYSDKEYLIRLPIKFFFQNSCRVFMYADNMSYSLYLEALLPCDFETQKCSLERTLHVGKDCHGVNEESETCFIQLDDRKADCSLCTAFSTMHCAVAGQRAYWTVM